MYGNIQNFGQKIWRHRLEDYVKMELREIEYEDVDWIYLAQDADQ
jgi:hypothetical protein